MDKIIKALWNFSTKIFRVILKCFLGKRLTEDNFGKILQFIKFALVGVSNTAISYGIEMLCYYVIFRSIQVGEHTKIIVTTALAFVISVTNSYFWNNRYVFASGKKSAKEHIITYIKTFICYGITGLIISPALKLILSGVGVYYWLSALVSLIVTIPLNFIMNKLWAFK